MSEKQTQQLFGRPREHLLSHFQFATELAMNRANFLRTRNMFMFMALLHYIVSFRLISLYPKVLIITILFYGGIISSNAYE